MMAADAAPNNVEFTAEQQKNFDLMQNDFLSKEVNRILGTRRANELFVDCEEFKRKDTFEKLQSEMTKKDTYKFTKKRNQLISSRLMLMT